MIIPEIASGAVDDLATLRSACDAAVSTILATDPERVVVIGAGEPGEDRDESAGGTFAPYGLDLHAGGAGTGLPLSLDCWRVAAGSRRLGRPSDVLDGCA